MNPKDNIEQLFKNLENTFDIAEPNTGHSQRFLDKLKHQNSAIITPNSKKNSYWKPFWIGWNSYIRNYFSKKQINWIIKVRRLYSNRCIY